MKLLKNHTLAQYLKVLSQKTPAPGGGSAAALTAALGAALLSMAARYSIGKNSSKENDKKLEASLRESERFKKRLCTLIDLDAQAYWKVVKAPRGSAAKKKALAGARKVPLEVARLCCKAVSLAPFLVRRGNKYLLSDIVAAVELLLAGYKAAMVNAE